MMMSFVGLPATKSSFHQITLAYHLCRKSLSGTPKVIRKAIDSSPYFYDIRPEDILPLLKPMTSKVMDCPMEYRGFRQLAITFVESRIDTSSAGKKALTSSAPSGSMGGTMGILNSIFPTSFTFDVHYCMRKHSISKTYAECYQLKLVMHLTFRCHLICLVFLMILPAVIIGDNG